MTLSEGLVAKIAGVINKGYYLTAAIGYQTMIITYIVWPAAGKI